MASPRSTDTAPLSEAIITAVAELVNDAQEPTSRKPSHSDISFEIEQAGLSHVDPRNRGRKVGKAKRIRPVLRWALQQDRESGEELVAALIAQIRGYGGFTASSDNYVGKAAFDNARRAFKSEGYELAEDGSLRPTVLEEWSGRETNEALHSYVRRAREGSTDAALLAGTGKDLLEATCAHVLVEIQGDYPENTNFPGLLGQAFVSLRMKTPKHPDESGEEPYRRFERALYELGCSVNTLRNKEGTGHGRPFLPKSTEEQARHAAQAMGVVAGYMLDRLDELA